MVLMSNYFLAIPAITYLANLVLLLLIVQLLCAPKVKRHMQTVVEQHDDVSEEEPLAPSQEAGCDEDAEEHGVEALRLELEAQLCEAEAARLEEMAAFLEQHADDKKLGFGVTGDISTDEGSEIETASICEEALSFCEELSETDVTPSPPLSPSAPTVDPVAPPLSPGPRWSDLPDDDDQDDLFLVSETRTEPSAEVIFYKRTEKRPEKVLWKRSSDSEQEVKVGLQLPEKILWKCSSDSAGPEKIFWKSAQTSSSDEEDFPVILQKRSKANVWQRNSKMDYSPNSSPCHARQPKVSKSKHRADYNPMKKEHLTDYDL